MAQLQRTELIQVVAALTEGVMLIDTNQAITYANEAALVMHGVDSLEDLGTTVDAYRSRFQLRYRNNHLLTPQDYPIERLMAGETFDEVIVEVERRDNPSSTWTHRIRSLVIGDSDGKPDLLVLILADVSDQFKAEERFSRTFGANPAPALICRIADQRFIKMNDGFEDLSGFCRDEVVGQTLSDLDVLSDATRRELALERLVAGETIPQMEALLPIADGGRKLVIVAGQTIEFDDAACMLFTFADLEPRRKAEAEAKDHRQRSEKMFRLAPVPMMLIRLVDHVVVEANDAFVAMTGREAGSSDLTATGNGLWASPKDFDRFIQSFQREGAVRELETMLREAGGAEFDALISAEAITIATEPYILCAFQDVSVRKRNEAELMRAIEAVMADASWFSQAVVERLATFRMPRRSGQPSAHGLATLTVREREVLDLLCRGLGNDDISQKLGLSRNTVHNHVSALFRKIGVNRRSAAVAWARDRGFGDGSAAKAKSGGR